MPRPGCVRPSDFASEGAGIAGLAKAICVVCSKPTGQRNVRSRVNPAVIIAIAAISLGTPAFAQSQVAPSQPEAQTPPDQSSTVIRSIQVVDVKDLKPALRSQVDELVKHTSEKDIQSLRASIDALPEAGSALKAKGLNSSHVVAINVVDGVLTLFAKKA